METVKKQIRNSMLEDIFAQGDMILGNIPSLEKQIAEAIDRVDINSLENIYITGCGDSFYASEVARNAFMEYCGITTHGVQAFEFNQYESRFLKGKGLTIAVSISGQVGTTLKTVEISKDKGFATLGLNATPGSKIYSIADAVIDIGVRVKDLGPIPQTYHFLGNITSLYLVALRIGLLNGTIDQVKYDKVKEEIIFNLKVMEQNAKDLKDRVFSYAKTVLEMQPYVVVGGGSNFTTALFGVAKLHEAACMSGVAQETEEWAHVQYFATDTNVLTFVVATEGFGLERSQAILAAIKSLGCKAVAVVDEKNSGNVDASEVWAVKTSENELLSPMSLKLPLELFAWAVSEHLDIRPFNYDNQTRKETIESTIYEDGVSGENVARQENK